MRRVFISAAAILLLCAVATQARVLVEEEESAGRALLQRTLDCTKVHRGCNTCRNQRIKGTKKTETVCSTCLTGWRLAKNNNKACECQPGLKVVDTSAMCSACTAGKFCPGGNGAASQTTVAAIGPESDCPSGLESKFAGAKSQAQCFTQAGYGRKSVRGTNGVITYEGVPCPVGTYNVGGNTAGCQKCGAGLTTASTQSTSPSACQAPAGSYLDKGVGKKCPKGTYTDALNTKSVCDACATGVTTVGEGSTSVAACDRAIKGYKYTAANTAEKCELNTYNDAENTQPTCTVCPFGWKTQADGADGLALCLAPPGFEQASAGATITECAEGSYKEGWNRNPCVACGTNVVTNATGSVSKDACLVPPGFGLTQLAPMIAQPCVANSYGDDVYRVAVASARCTACPPNMFTGEKWGSAAPATGYTDESACKVDAGFGLTETAVEECQVGYFNVGQNRLPCTACDAGYTTLATQSDAAIDCVIKKGWYYDAGKSLPAPCDKGTYSTGGDATTREPTACTACSAGFTTQEQEAESVAECAVCAAGYGAATAGATTCTRCDVNTFSSGGLAIGIECTPCATGTVSSKEATESSQCYPAFADPTRDYFTSTDAAAWADVSSPASIADCEAACGATCLQMRVSTATPLACQTMAVVAGKDVSFKVKGGIDYARYTIGTTTSLGKTLGSAAAADLTACENSCTPNGDCEGVIFNGTTCTQITSELDPDYTGFVHVTGAALRSYVA